MTSFRIRPRFRVEVEMKPEEIKTHFRERLEQPGAPCVAAFFPQHVILRVPPEERHFWSPCLELSLEEEGDHTLIRGLYGPNPQVWTMFILIYGAIGVLALFITITRGSRRFQSHARHERARSVGLAGVGRSGFIVVHFQPNRPKTRR